MAMTDVVLAVDGHVGRFGDSAGVSRPLIDCFYTMVTWMVIYIGVLVAVLGCVGCWWLEDNVDGCYAVVSCGTQDTWGS